MRRWLPWVLLGVVLAGALAVGASGDTAPRSNAERSADLAADLRCPTCRGQSVLDSNAPAAAAIRTEIARRVEAGQSDDEIVAYLDGRFGESLRLTPPGTGLAALVWVLPVAGLVVAAAGVGMAFRRWRMAPAPTVSADDRRRVRRALGQEP